MGRAIPSGGGGVAYVGAGTQYVEYGSLTTHTVPVPAGMSVGDYLLVACMDGAAGISSMVASNAQALSSLVSNLGSIWGVQISGTVPTSVTITLAAAGEYRAQALAYSGVSAVAGTTDIDTFGAERSTMDYSTDAGNAAVVCLYLSGSREVSAATFNGSDAADHLSKFPFNDKGIVAGIHDGSTGTVQFSATWTSPPDTGGRYIAVALKA